jgi:hypothetical protein
MTEQTNTEGGSQEAATMNPMEFITTTSGTDLLMAGPLAQAYSDGLNELYSKERTEEGMALETQAVDLGTIRRAFLAAKRPLLDTDNQANMGLFYGVQKGAVAQQHVIDVVDRLAVMSGKNRAESAVIIDAVATPRNHSPEIVQNHEVMNLALEQACARFGVTVYSSLEDFLQKRG